ncbi:MAG: threonine--tRNA ligase [Ignavibacteriales bacterium CG18_big_fil_WC_8_21_14_2_50_31_20]|nr:MAG: threonine--tRNA ligase [Ignavibacteriales bacterium CG18_big_fil_WC_8_21_14_2_50_31_20]
MSLIKITFPDGTAKEFEKGITPLQISKAISNNLAKEAIVSEINGIRRELNTPINEDSQVKIFTFDNLEGKDTYWHSTSHLMAHAIKEIYPEAKFGVGPSIDSGFYYDIDINTQLTEEDLIKIEKKMQSIIDRNDSFVRNELSKVEALKFFNGDQYKVELIEAFDENNTIISTYGEGIFTDLCTGPHLPSTKYIKAFKLLSVSGSYWRGDEKKARMQRIYGISFPKQKMLDDYLEFLEEAKRRDHRKLGKDLDLFSIHEEAGAGLIYWHPKGARVRNEIEDFWKKEHFKNGYDLLYSPHIGKSQLWETSGHLVNFKENMYSPMQIDEQDYYVKPMNCPFHILMYKSKLRSYRDLPLRWAELGTVYRYEKSGVLHGLLRVRGFTQDDAHIFCSKEQIESEIIEVIRFSNFMWNKFGFGSLKYYVSTRPDKVSGDDELWEQATRSLEIALEKEGLKYEIDEGGGAFYGPKIDIKIKDALNREWQMSTIQFDFNLPKRFDMKYIGEDGKEHVPFMVHRALLGSIERFMGVLIEHYAGAFPDWLAPVQVAVVPVSQNYFEYAQKVVSLLLDENIRVEFDKRNEKIGYKIRDWETQKVPYMLIVGEKEETNGTVSVRKHKHGDQGEIKTNEFISVLKDSINKKNNNN